MGVHFLIPLILVFLACDKPQESLQWINNYTPTTQPTDDPTDPSDPGQDTPVTPVNPDGGFIIVGYDYGPSDGSALPNPEFLTHINFAFGKVASDHETLEISKSKRLKKVVALKKSYPHLKVVLSVGGWGAKYFSGMAADEAKRKAFCKNCLDAVNEYGLDGIDIDWEYPGEETSQHIEASSNDRNNFTLLAKDLRETLGDGKLVTMATSAEDVHVNFSDVLKYMDWVNIMTYDMGHPTSSNNKHNAALYSSSMSSKSYCDKAVRMHYNAGVPYDRMTLGMPFYGRDDHHAFTEGDDDNLVRFKDLQIGKYTERWDNDAKVPYLTDPGTGSMVLSYDNEESIALKANYVREKGLKGAMYWAIQYDDANWTLSRAISTRLIGTGYQPEQPTDIPSYQVTNAYVQKYLEEVHYTDWDFSGTKIFNYEGGGPGVADVPPSITISWKAGSGNQVFAVWDQDWRREIKLSSGVNSQSLTNLVPGDHYYWQVTDSGNAVVAKGEFLTTGNLHQVYFNEKVRNARDLGGLKTLDGKTIRYRLLYRGGRTNYIKSDGKVEAKAEGIRAELDLREAKNKTDKSYFDGATLCYPGFEESENYRTMLNDDSCRPRMKEAFQFIVNSLRDGRPVYFHCAAGRDRTGTMAAVCLGVLGVPEGVIAQDYELTYFSPDDWSMSTNKETGERYYNHTRDVGSYKRMMEFLRDYENAGNLKTGCEKYLLSIGITQQDIDFFRSVMLK